eukprot:TRINITY_DN3265_c0_g1_i2.p1 TRINITY_DN3265_c0_g1~~TRINITY_DN3265_c0_g1_i2.p1  ORF type:complete len:345 (-),score=69.34 TRINITY_DN3265_c0_g1_i2:1160-2101(-)
MAGAARVALLVLLLVYGVCALSGSKLSIHTGMGDNSWAVLQQGQPRLVKLLDNFSQAADIKQQLPGIIIVGRIYLEDQPNTGDPKQTAQQWWDGVSSTIAQYPAVDYWEGYNEPAVGSLDDMEWYAAFEVARVQILAHNGFNASIANFATGTPDVTNAQIIEAFYPAIDAAIQTGGILGLHEYSAPYMNSSFDFTTGQGWLTGRYRMLYSQYLLPTNRALPLVVSENGIDGGTCGVTGCSTEGGWQNFCAQWAGSGSSDCNQEYMNQLAWYDSLMRADDYVIGSTIFTIDISGWESFDITPLVPDLIKYLSNQ